MQTMWMALAVVLTLAVSPAVADSNAITLPLNRRRDFLEDRNVRPQRFYRIVNEVPTLLLIVIVIMVIVRPF